MMIALSVILFFISMTRVFAIQQYSEVIYTKDGPIYEVTYSSSDGAKENFLPRYTVGCEFYENENGESSHFPRHPFDTRECKWHYKCIVARDVLQKTRYGYINTGFSNKQWSDGTLYSNGGPWYTEGFGGASCGSYRSQIDGGYARLKDRTLDSLYKIVEEDSTSIKTILREKITDIESINILKNFLYSSEKEKNDEL